MTYVALILDGKFHSSTDIMIENGIRLTDKYNVGNAFNIKALYLCGKITCKDNDGKLVDKDGNEVSIENRNPTKFNQMITWNGGLPTLKDVEIIKKHIYDSQKYREKLNADNANKSDFKTDDISADNNISLLSQYLLELNAIQDKENNLRQDRMDVLNKILNIQKEY